MTCPFCHSQRVSFPTSLRGHLHLKAGPATCLSCGAKEERIKIGPEEKDGMRSRWVPPPKTED